MPSSFMFGSLVALGVVLGACQPKRPASAPELLAAAHRAMGVTDSLRTIWSVASVASPSGGFETRIASGRTGDVRISMGQDLLAGVRNAQGWACDATGEVTPLDAITRSVVRGHDLHMMVVAPSWLATPVRGPDQRWGEDSVMTLRFQDELGGPLLLYLRLSDSLPLGVDLVNHTGAGAREVRVTLEDWQPLQSLRLFRKATFAHGGNRFVYSYTTLAINTLGPLAFLPGCAADSAAGAG